MILTTKSYNCLGAPLEDWESAVWPRLVDLLVAHTSLDQENSLDLLEVGISRYLRTEGRTGVRPIN